MVNDTLSDVLTRIRNGCLNKSQLVSIPATRLSQQVCHTLEKEGFIESFQRDNSLPTGSGFASPLPEGAKAIKSKICNKSDLLIVKLKYSDVDFGDNQGGIKNNNQTDTSIKNSQALSKKRPCITNLKRISKPGLRVYVRHKQIPTVLGGLGILILSTPKGIMTDREARFRKVGGEILCSVW